MPAAMRSVVVLPAKFGPISPEDFSLGLDANERSSTVVMKSPGSVAEGVRVPTAMAF